MRVASGVSATLFGLAFLLYIYAHASIVNPALTGEERRARIVEKLFLQSGIAEGTYVGIGIAAAGMWLVVGRPRLGAAQTPNQALQPTTGTCRLSQGHSSLGPRRG